MRVFLKTPCRVEMFFLYTKSQCCCELALTRRIENIRWVERDYKRWHNSSLTWLWPPPSHTVRVSWMRERNMTSLWSFQPLSLLHHIHIRIHMKRKKKKTFKFFKRERENERKKKDPPFFIYIFHIFILLTNVDLSLSLARSLALWGLLFFLLLFFSSTRTSIKTPCRFCALLFFFYFLWNTSNVSDDDDDCCWCCWCRRAQQHDITF